MASNVLTPLNATKASEDNEGWHVKVVKVFDECKVASGSQTNDEPPCNDNQCVDTVRVLACRTMTTSDTQKAGTILGWARQDRQRGLIGNH